jgi:O-antigen/teichoic acid export membrane protein
VLVIGALVAAATWAGRLFFAESPQSYAELGRFEAANQWRTAILFLPAAMTRVFLPLIAQAHGGSSGIATGAAVDMQLSAVRLITLPCVLVVIAASPLLAALYGRDFQGTDRIMPLLMASVFFFALNQTLRQVLNGTGHAWANLGLHVLWSGVFLAACVALIPEHGALGLAVAFLVGEVCHCVLQLCWVELKVVPGPVRQEASGIAVSSLAIAVACAARMSGGMVANFMLVALVIASLLPAVNRLRRS